MIPKVSALIVKQGKATRQTRADLQVDWMQVKHKSLSAWFVEMHSTKEEFVRLEIDPNLAAMLSQIMADALRLDEDIHLDFKEPTHGGITMKCRICGNEVKPTKIDMQDVDDTTGVVRQHAEFISDGTICIECLSTDLKSEGFQEERNPMEEKAAKVVAR